MFASNWQVNNIAPSVITRMVALAMDGERSCCTKECRLVVLKGQDGECTEEGAPQTQSGAEERARLRAKVRHSTPSGSDSG